MSELIKHECGIALIRLRKPLEFYKEKYGTWQYGLNKLYLLMEKQHNRGQDGAGIVNVKMELDPGQEYINRHRSIEQNPIKNIYFLTLRKDKFSKFLKSDLYIFILLLYIFPLYYFIFPNISSLIISILST